jgi:predicted transcriptional regulator
VKIVTVAKLPQKIEVTLDADLMAKLKTKADATNKTPSEMIAEVLRQQLR